MTKTSKEVQCQNVANCQNGVALPVLDPKLEDTKYQNCTNRKCACNFQHTKHLVIHQWLKLATKSSICC
eukprot:14402417-Ditylum_brightwellii.AAC.1